jgi:aspartate aminotransferase
MVRELTNMGYQLQSPEGTFYLMPRSPWKDDLEFAELLTEHDVFVLPGAVFESPGDFRISLTASEEMIARALPGFRAAIDYAVCHLPGTNLAAAD